MNYSLGYTLGRSMVFSRGDADALAYIAAVEGTGTSVSATQKTAINDFYVAAKADSYYTSLKRLYLPIWASAAPNAIDMIGLTSGTFNGTVTHSAGYVQGDGSTGYFNTGIRADAIITNESGSIGSLNYTSHNSVNESTVGCGTSGASSIRCGVGASGATPQTIWLGVNVIRSGVGSGGICISTRISGSTIHTKRNTVGVTEDSTTAALTASLTSVNLIFLASNSIPTGSTSHRVGAYFAATGLETSTRSTFSLALKNLWETCTSLSLP